MSPRIALALLALLAVALTVPRADAQTRLIRQVIGSGAATATSAQYFMAGTVGQTIIGRSTSSSNVGSLGFWYTYPLAGTTGVRDDGSWLPTGPIAHLSVSPNPVQAVANISIWLPMNGPVTLQLFDQLGRERRNLMEGTREAGSRTVSFEASDLESGDYTLVLTTAAGRVAERLRVVR